MHGAQTATIPHWMHGELEFAVPAAHLRGAILNIFI